MRPILGSYRCYSAPIAALRRSVYVIDLVRSSFGCFYGIGYTHREFPLFGSRGTEETHRARNRYIALSHILTAKEYEYLRVMQRAIGDVRGSYVTCLLYDGCVVRYDTKEALADVRHVLGRMIGAIGVGVTEKPRGGPRFDAAPMPAALLFTGKAYFEEGADAVLYSQIDVRGACLFNSVRNLVWPEVCPSAPRDGPFCVADYNQLRNDLPLEEGGRYKLIRAHGDFLLPGKYVAYHPYDGGAGHFSGVHVVEEGVVHLYDDTCRRRLRVEMGTLRKSLNGRDGSYVSHLLDAASSTLLPKNEYTLDGDGARTAQGGDEIRNPLQRRPICNCRIGIRKVVTIDVLTFSEVARGQTECYYA